MAGLNPAGQNTAGQNTAVFGVFKTASRAKKAIDRLTSAGFSNSDVSILESDIDRLLASLGIPGHQAKRYEGYVIAGSILLSVHCGNSLEIDRANTILEQNGAEEICSAPPEALSTPGRHKP